ncbi:hypothetical protein RMSM_06257 [Rhodopirellula maiorica SM1]|uniref:Uncharacterized protein n=1 Tax=Rhodopirellula maiorica SM1 TaxID=1265738 RepID=M5RN71_9BACT|nr:hypothetical protein RMSM_06257 [Rhodopirellula maiorica SM1]
MQQVSFSSKHWQIGSRCGANALFCNSVASPGEIPDDVLGVLVIEINSYLVEHSHYKTSLYRTAWDRTYQCRDRSSLDRFSDS